MDDFCNHCGESWQNARLLACEAEQRKDWREAESQWSKAAILAPFIGLEASFYKHAKRCAKNAARVERQKAKAAEAAFSAGREFIEGMSE